MANFKFDIEDFKAKQEYNHMIMRKVDEIGELADQAVADGKYDLADGLYACITALQKKYKKY